MDHIMQTLNALLVTYGLNVIAALAIFVVGRWVAGGISRLVEKTMLKSNADRALITFVKNLSYIALLAFVIIAALGRLGVQTASFVAILAAAGLAIGLALQGALSNFAAGVLMIIFRPFKAGDFIDAGGAMGTVQEIQIFNTILHTPDNRLVIVPNGSLTSGNITNFSANETRRVDLVIGVSYEDDLRNVKQLLNDLVTQDPKVLKEPEPVVAVSELGDSSVNFVVRPWVNAADYWSVYFGLTERLKLELEQNGFSIPYPQRDVHVKKGQLTKSLSENPL
jgi:small conductance mechanosensitive channel